MHPNKYKKRPVIIEAIQLTTENILDVEKWCQGSVRGTLLAIDKQEIAIQTLEGEMRAGVGDYVICGIKGEFYPCKPDIFEVSHELVS